MTAEGRASARQQGLAPLASGGTGVEDAPSKVVWVECPNCGYRFSATRHGGPQKEMHRRGSARRHTRACRLVVTPDPIAPDYSAQHRIDRVPDELRIEDVVERRCYEWEAEFGVGSHIQKVMTG